MAALNDLSFYTNRSLGGVGAEEINSPQAQAMLAALRQYDPNAYFRPTEMGGQTGYTLDFNGNLIPGYDPNAITTTGTGFNGQAMQWGDQLKDPNAVTHSDLFGDQTQRSNIKPQERDWLDIVGPLAVAAFGFGIGGIPGFTEGFGSQFSTLGGAGGGAAATDPFLAGGTGAMDMTGSAGTGLAGSTGAAGAGAAATTGGAAAGGSSLLTQAASALGISPDILKTVLGIAGPIVSGAIGAKTAHDSKQAATERLDGAQNEIRNLLGGGGAYVSPLSQLGPQPIAQNFQPLGMGRGIVGGPGAPTTLGQLSRGR